MACGVHRRMMTAGAMIVALIACTAIGGGSLRAQGPQIYNVGSLPVSGATWNFDSDINIGQGPWQSVTITNTRCFVGPDNPMPGTASAGLMIWFAQLTALTSQAPISVYEGTLSQTMGGSAVGHVRVVTPLGEDQPTHIDASLYGLEEFAQGNLLLVCLQSY